MGGSDSILESKDKYTYLFLRIISVAAISFPIVLISYGILAYLGLVGRSDLYTNEINLTICVAMVILALVQFYTSYHYQYAEKLIFAYIILFHVLGGLFVLYIGGFMNPPTVFWLPLIVISNLYYGHKGTFYSSVALMSVAFLAYALQPDESSFAAFNILLYATTIIAIGVFVSMLKKIHSTEHTDLVRSQKIRGKQRGQLESLVNSIGEAIISINTSGIVQTYNAATLNLLDTNQSLGGKHLDDVLHLYDEHGAPQKLFTHIKQKAMVHENLAHRFGDGEEMKLGITVSTVRSKNTVDGYIILFRDITKSKSLEEERDEFIAVVSHELRTPITITEGALSNVQLLMERDASKEQLKNMLSDAHDQVLYLAKMVNDLSTLSRAERGVADDMEVIDVREMLHDLFSQYQPKAEEKKLHLNLDIKGKLGNVLASRLYLEEMLQNFITNAIKYTEKGEVTIHASVVKDAVVFEIQDTGIGISKTDQKKVFEKFYRSEDYRTRETSGTGLGLYVVQKLSHKLGTKIHLTSRLNHGSTFSFSLPLTDQKLDPSVDEAA